MVVKMADNSKRYYLLFAVAVLIVCAVFAASYLWSSDIVRQREVYFEGRLNEIKAAIEGMPGDTNITKKNYEELFRLYDELLYYKSEERFFRKDVYENLIKKYTVNQLNMIPMLGANADNLVVLFFYTEGDFDSNRQDVILGHFSQKLGNLYVIYIIADLNIDEVAQQRAEYKVDVVPSIVVRGNTYSGFVDKDNFEEILCKYAIKGFDCPKIVVNLTANSS